MNLLKDEEARADRLESDLRAAVAENRVLRAGMLQALAELGGRDSTNRAAQLLFDALTRCTPIPEQEVFARICDARADEWRTRARSDLTIPVQLCASHEHEARWLAQAIRGWNP